jgi:hypothetical protein
MMTVPTEVVKSTMDALKATPFLLAALVLNIIVLAGFSYTLKSVSDAMERREAILKACIEK